MKFIVSCLIEDKISKLGTRKLYINGEVSYCNTFRSEYNLSFLKKISLKKARAIIKLDKNIKYGRERSEYKIEIC